MTKQTWRYHATKKPQLVSMEDSEKLEAMEQEGWRDSPAAFTEMSLDTPAVREMSNVQYALLDTFREDPESLDKDELVNLGKGLGVKLIKSWKEETLVAKIKERLTNGDNQAAN